MRSKCQGTISLHRSIKTLNLVAAEPRRPCVEVTEKLILFIESIYTITFFDIKQISYINVLSLLKTSLTIDGR